MGVKEELLSRSDSTCELCGSSNDLSVQEVVPSDGTINQCLIVCSTCKEQIENPSKIDVNHWHCLNDTIWSNITPVQVMSYRILKTISNHDWTAELLDMVYLEDDIKQWADKIDMKEEK